jgi:Tfp pilus assembly protein PilE
MRNSKGSSLIELVIVIVVIGFLALLIGNIPSAINLVGKANHQSTAREIIAKEVEALRGTKYENLVNGTTAISDTRINMLPAGSSTVLIEDCSASVCKNSEATKQVTVTVGWKEAGKAQTAKVQTLISQGGLNQ